MPTYVAKYYAGQQIEGVVNPIWKVHKNRVDQGKGATYSSSGYHEANAEYKDLPATVTNWVVSFSQMFNGLSSTINIDNPFLRHHKSFEEYSSHLYDQDDYAFTITDSFERQKMQAPLKKDVVGGVNFIPPMDNDEKFQWSNLQGENVFTNPPNPNRPQIDHGVDEEKIWAFPLSNYNQEMVFNNWYGFKGHTQSNAPMWGHKLAMPHFYKPEKMEKFFRHWHHRKGLEALKQKHVLAFGPSPTEEDQVTMQNEISQYIEKCYEYEEAEKLKDVYVSDHSAPEQKFLTHSSAEDKALYEYHQALEEYNASNSEVSAPASKPAAKPENQLIAELFAGDTPFSAEHFESVLQENLDVFKNGEKYDFVKDLRDAYKKSLAQSVEKQILATIPDHHFWDIKKPQQKEIYVPKNRYNPFRGREFADYFEMVNQEEYMASQHDQDNRNPSVSYYRRY